MSSELYTPSGLLIRKLESIFSLSEEEKQAIKDLPIKIKEHKAHQSIVNIGDRPSHCCIVLEGFAYVYKDTIQGKRQILALHIPGDMPDLQSLHLQVLDINIASLSSCKLGYIEHDDLRRLCESYPRLTAAFWRETLVQASIYREWLVNNGQREGYARIAHLICELMVRLKAVDLVKGNKFAMPASQAELADATGMTPVHMNRVLQALRGDGLLVADRNDVAISDWEALKVAGEFEPLYLHFLNEAA
ncbi:Crp/Fnr family transcriptional regulator [Vreelandella sp. H-I2]